jgi:trehalose 6-phosphate phosphatase
MIETALAGIPESFWRRAADSEHRLLMVDYDGTLAPFRTNRIEAVPLDLSISQLRTIASGRNTTVVILSGRPIRELESFITGLAVQLVGEGGWEEKSPGGSLVRHPLPRGVEAALGRAAAAAPGYWSQRLERKRTSLMLHTRGLPVVEAAEILQTCGELWRAELAAGLRLVRLDGGIELRAKGRDKGTAVRDLLERSPRGTLAVHIGDDELDEDAFEVLLDSGFGIRIGDPRVPSGARGRLASWIDLPLFLKRWIGAVERRDARQDEVAS